MGLMNFSAVYCPAAAATRHLEEATSRTAILSRGQGTAYAELNSLVCEKTFILDPAQLPCLLVRRCPRQAEEFWKGDFARFVWARPRMEGAGHEPVLLRFFVSNAETCAGHCHDKNIATYFDSDLLSSDQI